VPVTDFQNYLENNSQRISQMVNDFFEHPANPDIRQYLYQPLADFTANGGKRHRPLICELACLAVGGDAARVKSAAAAIEHFHTAALIHDDIADESELRRGEPCLYKLIGPGLAINAGDLALSQVTGLVVNDAVLDNATKIRVLDELVQMTTRTIEGQALDLGWVRDGRFDLTIDDYLLMATLKTAHYSGGTPLAVGAIIGGGNVQQIAALRAYGIAAGLAFQIQDDLLNLVGTPNLLHKDFRNDITEGKRTLMAIHAIQNSGQALELIALLNAHSTDPVVQARAVEIMEQSGSLAFAHHLALKLVQEAQAGLPHFIAASPYRDLLSSMADFFVERLN